MSPYDRNKIDEGTVETSINWKEAIAHIIERQNSEGDATKTFSQLGDEIKIGRKRHNMLRSVLAQHIGKSNTWLALLESGLIPQNEINTTILESIAQHLKIPLLRLLVLAGVADEDLLKEQIDQQAEVSS